MFQVTMWAEQWSALLLHSRFVCGVCMFSVYVGFPQVLWLPTSAQRHKASGVWLIEDFKLPIGVNVSVCGLSLYVLSVMNW